MKVSAITEFSDGENLRRNAFIRLSNSFMSSTASTDPIELTRVANKKHVRLGIENLHEFTVYPREVIDGKTVVTA